jgi:hypothetical protein
LIAYQVFFSTIAFICIFQYLFREMKELSQEGWRKYFSSIWNIWGLATEVYAILYIASLFYMLTYREEGIRLDNQRFYRQISAWAIFMLWLKLFYWLQLWDVPAYFIIQMQKTAEAVQGFLIILLVMILTFANFFYIIQKNLPPDGWKDDKGDSYNYVEGIIDNAYIDSFTNMYLASLGEFNSMAGYSGGYNQKSAWLMFLLATVLLLMILLNMLIGIITEAFNEVVANKNAEVLKKKVEMIVTYIDLVDLKETF